MEFEHEDNASTRFSIAILKELPPCRKDERLCIRMVSCLLLLFETDGVWVSSYDCAYH